MIIILIILGLSAGFMILSGVTKGKLSGEVTGGYTKGKYTGKGGKTIGGAIGGTVKNWASLTTKTWMGSKDSFYRQIGHLVKGYDWDKLIPLTMSALETNYAKSCYFNNLFNITTSTTDPNQFFMYKTIPDLKFKVYIGYAESVKHFWDLLKLSRYALAYQNRHNPEQAITELIKAGYAGSMTDPTRYLNTLRYIRRNIPT